MLTRKSARQAARECGGQIQRTREGFIVKTETDFADELTYIQSIDPRAPGDTFNNDPACFGRYAAMQAKHAERAGFYAIADLMRKHVA